MRLHLEDVLDLHQVGVLAVAHGDDLVERAEQLEAEPQHLALVHLPAPSRAQSIAAGASTDAVAAIAVLPRGGDGGGGGGGPAEVGDEACEEVERLDVLEDVAVLVGDEDHVQVLQGLVDVADVLRLDRRVLAARADQLGEGGEEHLDARARHVAELPRDDGCVHTQRDREGGQSVGWRLRWRADGSRGDSRLPPRVQMDAASTTCHTKGGWEGDSGISNESPDEEGEADEAAITGAGSCCSITATRSPSRARVCMLRCPSLRTALLPGRSSSCCSLTILSMGECAASWGLWVNAGGR